MAPLRFWFEYAPSGRANWMAGYPETRSFTDNRGIEKTRQVRVVIDDVVSEECPRSILIQHPEIEDLVMMFNREQILPGSLGSPSKWPGALAGAFEILTTQRELDKYARHTAK